MAQVDGKTVKVGDYVSFKSDVEQGGRIAHINGKQLTLNNPNGFQGEYIGGQRTTVVYAEDCWLEN